MPIVIQDTLKYKIVLSGARIPRTHSSMSSPLGLAAALPIKKPIKISFYSIKLCIRKA